MREPQFGESRTDRYMRAKVDMPKGCYVRVCSPYTVEPLTGTIQSLFGKTLSAVKRNKGVWVRYAGVVAITRK